MPYGGPGSPGLCPGGGSSPGPGGVDLPDLGVAGFPGGSSEFFLGAGGEELE